MEQRIRDQYHPEILKTALQKFELESAEVTELRGFENFIFQVKKGKENLVLKLVHSIRRTNEQAEGEAEFLQYLKDEGLGVAAALPSPEGNFVETVDASDGYFCALVYEFAEGGRVAPENFNDALMENMGLSLIHI